MKKYTKGFILGFLICAVLTASIPAFATIASKSIKVLLNSVTVKVNTTTLSKDNIIYNGKTYVNASSISKALNKKFDWNKKTNVITIKDKATPSPTPSIAPKIATGTPAGSGDISKIKVTRVSMQTSKGNIEFALRPDLMPITVANFMMMVKNEFLKGLTFHRVEDWVIQGGDPTIVGKVAPNWTIELETDTSLNNVRGAIGMARTSVPNSANSQFYILKQTENSLDGQYAIFGNVTKGMDVVDKIAIGDKIISVTEMK